MAQWGQITESGLSPTLSTWIRPALAIHATIPATMEMPPLADKFVDDSGKLKNYGYSAHPIRSPRILERNLSKESIKRALFMGKNL